MKFHSMRRILSVLLAGALAVGLLGCAKETEKVVVEPMEAEEVNTLTFATTGGEDVMPIAVYYGPMSSTYSYSGEKQPDFITDEWFKIIADSGINLINHSYTDYASQTKSAIKMLELGEKYGLGICVYDANVLDNKEMSLTQLSDRISEYSDYPAFAGLYIVDEPQWAEFYLGDGTRTIDHYAPILQKLAQLGVYGYANALPDYGQTNKGDNYDDYLKYFIENCNLPYLSYDSYIWDEGHTMENYFYNLSTVRECAQAYDIPFWTFIQTGSQWNDGMTRFDSKTPYYPNEKQFQWNVNVNLAYGAQGMQYFTLFQPYYFAWAESEPFDFNRNGMIGAWGNLNEWYFYVQNVNKQIAAVDEVLMHSKNKGVIVTSEQAKLDNISSTCIIEGEAWRELVSVDGDAMIGCFNYQGKTALYVVNYDYEYAQNITLHFNDTHNVSVTYEAETTYESTDELTLTMQAGRGALVVFD